MLKRDVSVEISSWTARRIWKKHDFKAAEKKKKPLLSKKNIKMRLTFAKKYLKWTVSDWERVIWSDETKINRISSDGPSWCWILKGEPLQLRHVKQALMHGRGNVMFWGCMTVFGVGSLHKITGIMNQHMYKDILNHNLLEVVETMPFPDEMTIFQRDRDPKHVARSV